MKTFIFITDEGFTTDPNKKEIENLQVLGTGEGKDILEAFKHFKTNQSYLKEFAFKEVIALEYVGDFIRNLEL
jgi:phosphatidylinositol kinase/protein kinase (PI-3  family)